MKKKMEAAPDAEEKKQDSLFAAPPMNKAEDAEEDEGEEGDEEDEEGMEMAKKGYQKSVDLTGEDLEKSLQKLTEIVQAGDTTTRKDALLSKAQTGEELSKSERSELFGLLGGQDQPQEKTLSDDLTKGLTQNGAMQEALDVSNYLTEQHAELCKSLGALGEHVEKSDARQHEFNLVLAKAVADVGNLVKAVAETVGAIAGQPARAPKSMGVAGGKVLSKSFAGSQPSEDQLSKSEILDTLDTMMEKSMAAGRGGRSAAGEDLLMAISKYEQTSALSPSLLAEVRAHRSGNHAVAH